MEGRNLVKLQFRVSYLFQFCKIFGSFDFSVPSQACRWWWTPSSKPCCLYCTSPCWSFYWSPSTPSWAWSSSSARCTRPATTLEPVRTNTTRHSFITCIHTYIVICRVCSNTLRFPDVSLQWYLLVPQISIPQQKVSCLHPALRPETDVAAKSIAQSVGQDGRVPTMESPTLITLDSPCSLSSSVSPWRDGQKCSTGSVTGCLHILLTV